MAAPAIGGEQRASAMATQTTARQPSALEDSSPAAAALPLTASPPPDTATFSPAQQLSPSTPSLSRPPPPRPPKEPIDADTSTAQSHFEDMSRAVIIHPRPLKIELFDPDIPEPPAPRPRTPPHRKYPAKRPGRGILKPPPPPQAKFSFKRDILAPVSSRLGYADVSESPLGAVIQGGNGVQAAAGWVSGAWKRLGQVAAAERVKMEGQVQAQMQSRGINRKGADQGQSLTTTDSTILELSQPGPSAGFAGPYKPRNSQHPSLDRRSSVDTMSTTSLMGSIPPSSQVLSVSTLKKVHFAMSELKVVYPISNVVAPSVDGNIKRHVDLQYVGKRRQRRDAGESNGWTSQDLESLYDDCCRSREEGWGVARVRQALKDSIPAPPRSLDLTGVHLTPGSAQALGDLLSVNFGLKKLILENCGLEDDSLKPLLHALLISGNLPTLSLADNRRLKARGWKYIAIFAQRAKALRYLDLSDNNVDRRAIDYLAQALDSGHGPRPVSAPNSPASSASPTASNGMHSPIDSYAPSIHQALQLPSDLGNGDDQLFAAAPLLRESNESNGISSPASPRSRSSASIISLRLENCNLKNPALESLAQGVRDSRLKHISLRRNRIGPVGAIALAVMIRDWPSTGGNPFGSIINGTSGDDDSPTGQSGPGFDTSSTIKPSPLNSLGRFESSNSVTARQTGMSPPGISRRHMVSPGPSSPIEEQVTYQNCPPSKATSQVSHDDEDEETFGPEQRSLISQTVEREAKRATEARLRLRKHIDPLPRIGTLLTLDVKSNEIRSGVGYIAQVMKRNRTLKVLNLSDNKIDMVGLVALADALRYNTTLETLDLSRNPCCGPGLDGVSALRSAFVVNASLKRIFLNATDLSSEGAIALAEFLPEVRSLIHLDLTENLEIDIAGLMALAASIKMNTSLRCLDVNIPPNDPDFARLSQHILQSCARNTEIAQAEAIARGVTAPISAPMLKSTIARELNTRQEQEEVRQKRQAEREEEFKVVLVAVEEGHEVLMDIVKEDEGKITPDGRVDCSELAQELLDQAKANQIQLRETMKGMRIGELKDRATMMNEQLSALILRADVLYSGQTSTSVSTAQSAGLLSPTIISPVSDEPSSPSFSITDDSSSSEDEASPTPSPSGTVKGNLNSANRVASGGPKALRLTMPTSIPGERSETDAEKWIQSAGQLSPRSPVEAARGMSMEEGEVFRRGTVLGVGAVEESEDDDVMNVTGEALKETILEADIAPRSPRGSISSPPSSPTISLSSPRPSNSVDRPNLDSYNS